MSTALGFGFGFEFPPPILSLPRTLIVGMEVFTGMLLGNSDGDDDGDGLLGRSRDLLWKNSGIP